MILQNIVFPQATGGYSEGMFYRGDCICLRSEQKLIIKSGKTVSLDTFFNAIQVKVWRGDCCVENLYVELRGQGQVAVQFCLNVSNKAGVVLGERVVHLKEQGTRIEIPKWETLKGGIVFIQLKALEDCVLIGGAFVTDQKPNEDVKLGLVITHFNRQVNVISAAKKITNEIFNDNNYSNIDLVIVDNSNNLPVDEIDSRIVVVKNKNLGGSGGFSRGLLYLKDHGYTHCNFMDDDASCLSESIKRTYSFFSFYCGTEPLGLSGILLRDSDPRIVHESGTIWKNANWEPINQGKNLENIPDLMAIDWCNKQGSYGAWCYFGFKISDIKHWPFPFFVRGDDILFSLQNKLKIITLFGVATCIDSFLNKENCTTRYLAFRSLLVISTFMGDSGVISWWRRYKDWNDYCTFSYCYTQAYAVYMALRDVLKKESVFITDIYGVNFRRRLKALPDFEKALPFVDFPMSQGTMRESRVHWFIRKITLNGLLIPKKFFKGCVWHEKRDWINFRQIYRFRAICYYNDDSNSAFIANHNKVELWKGICRDFVSLFVILFYYKAAKTKISNELNELTTEDFWRKIFNN